VRRIASYAWHQISQDMKLGLEQKREVVVDQVRSKSFPLLASAAHFHLNPGDLARARAIQPRQLSLLLHANHHIKILSWLKLYYQL
jgi:hypothetical protein